MRLHSSLYTTMKQFRRKQGFTLVEVMVVIGVMGVMAGVAIPLTSGIIGQSTSQVSKRHAQNIVQMFNSARAAGNKGVFDLDSAVAAVTSATGISGSGAFAGSTFTAVMNPVERDAAKAKITTSGNGSEMVLVYNP
jgi:prepilin-type N-terminal cleavage/methylation domain-containing protein